MHTSLENRWKPSEHTIALLRKRAILGVALEETQRRTLNRSISPSCRADYRAHVEGLVEKIASRLPKGLRLRLLNASTISTLLYECESGN